MFIPHKTFSVIRDHLVHHNCKENEVHVKYKKIENTRLDRLRILLKTKRLFSYLPLHFGNLLCSPKIGNEWRKKASPKQVEWRKRHIIRRHKRNANQMRRDSSNDKVQRKTFSRCFRKACCCPSIPAGYMNDTPYYLVVYIYICNRESTSFVLYIIPCPKELTI